MLRGTGCDYLFPLPKSLLQQHKWHVIRSAARIRQDKVAAGIKIPKLLLLTEDMGKSG